MRIDKLKINDFKNLKDFQIDIDESQLTSVFIGRNGAGKSNLLEAIVIIFRDLDLGVFTKDFSYEIFYRCSGHAVRVKNNVSESKQEFLVDGKVLTRTNFYKQKREYLPEHVFAYYSGPSNRLEKHFAKHQKQFYRALLDGDNETLRPLFYARLIHSNFVLLAFFSFFEEKNQEYISDLIEEVRIKIRKTDGTIITFNELSEGEQQLLMVLGLLKFTQSKESLFLLDEPDTHLNPAWKYDYLTLIKNVVGQSESSQVIISTHDPIVIGGLNKEAVTIFDRTPNGTTVRMPEVDPKGMGVAGLLTSDLFGLPTTLDNETQNKLDRKLQLQYKKENERTLKESAELTQLTQELEQLGFSRTTRDPLYGQFLEHLYSRPEFQDKPITDVERKKMTELMDDILEEILEEEDK